MANTANLTHSLGSPRSGPTLRRQNSRFLRRVLILLSHGETSRPGKTPLDKLNQSLDLEVGEGRLVFETGERREDVSELHSAGVRLRPHDEVGLARARSRRRGRVWRPPRCVYPEFSSLCRCQRDLSDLLCRYATASRTATVLSSTSLPLA
jgi:hypothetical protein